MSTPSGPFAGTGDGLGRHRLLLGLAGRVCDAGLVAARSALAAGDEVGVDAFLAEHWDLLPPAPGDVRATETVPPFGFTPAGPTALAEFGDRMGATVDLTGGPDAEVPGLADELDAAAATAVADVPGAVGLWRSWRFPSGLTADLPLARIHLVEVVAGTGERELAEMAERVRADLDAAGLDEPLVEVFATGQPIPAYQRAARSAAALLWAREPWHPVRLARTFDAGSPPRFLPGHPMLAAGPLRSGLLARLHAGAVLLRTSSLMDDVVTGEAAVVPLSLRTNGRWLWTEATAYYLEHYGLAPEPEFSAYLTADRAQPGTADGVDGVAWHRAMAALSTPDWFSVPGN